MHIDISQVGIKRKGAKLFSVMPSDRACSSGHKLKHMKFHFNMQENFFT